MRARTLESLFNNEDEKVVKCPECGRTVRLDEDVLCPECGIELSDSEDISEIEASMSDSDEDEDMACYYDEDGVPMEDMEEGDFDIRDLPGFEDDEDEGFEDFDDDDDDNELSEEEEY